MSPRGHTLLSKPSWPSTMPSISASGASSSTTRTRPFVGYGAPAEGVMAFILGGSTTTPPHPERVRGRRGWRSVAVVLRLVRTRDVDADVLGLLLGQLGELD